MQKKEILEILKKHTWKEEEGPAEFFILDHICTCNLEAAHVYKKKFFTSTLYIFDRGYGHEWAPIDEGLLMFDWALKKTIDNPYCWNMIDKKFAVLEKKIKIFSDTIGLAISRYSNHALYDAFLTSRALMRQQYGYSNLAESADSLEEIDYHKKLVGINPAKATDIIAALSAPDNMVLLERNRLGLLKIAHRYFGGIGLKINLPVRRALDNHARKFYWLQNSFKCTVMLDRKYFYKELQALIRGKTKSQIKKEIFSLERKSQLAQKKQRDIIKKNKLTNEAVCFFQLLRFLTQLQDRRKELFQRLTYCIELILREIVYRTRVPKQQVYFYLFTELDNLLHRGVRVPVKKLVPRKCAVAFSYFQGSRIKTRYFFGTEGDFIINFFKKRRQSIANQKVIKGFVASAGRGEQTVSGTVRIILDPSRATIQSGEILVTGMTRPEFVPLMKKSKAIITNEGGITTHAAIISRELKIPCVIGTKVATDVLKNGDSITLNLTDGTVTVLGKK